MLDILVFADLVSTDQGWLEHLLKSPDQMVFWGAAISTFVAAVMAEKEQTRLRNGAYGAAFGSAIGAMAGAFESQPTYVVVGFLGSAIGGVGGWLVHLVVSVSASSWPRFRSVLAYQVGGVESVKQQIEQDEERLLTNALREWRDGLVRSLNAEKSSLTAINDDASRDAASEMLIRNWLTGFVQVYGLVFDAIASKERYRSRVTIIVYGKDDDGAVTGKHWISYSGSLPTHRKSTTFPESSIGYKVLVEEVSSPYFTDEDVSETGHSRGKGQPRPFYTFRLTNNAILALDWPSTLKEKDKSPYVRLGRDMFHQDLCPAIATVLGSRAEPLEHAVGLKQIT
jgi:hypothetical protein